MRTVYDTSTVPPLDRYEYYRDGAACELAPVEVRGHAPVKLLAAMSFGTIGGFTVEEFTWEADAEVRTRRTERLIRVGDPDMYRLVVGVAGEVRLEQSGSRVRVRAGDIGFYDLSRPWVAAHSAGISGIRVVMLTFPRAVLPIDERALRPLLGTVAPRSLAGRGLVAQLVGRLPRVAEPTDVAGVLPEAVVGLIRRWLGLPGGMTLDIQRSLQLARIRDVIRTNLADPALGPDRIAKALAISPRYLHKLLHDIGQSPMRLVKQQRLEECRRRLADPTLRHLPIQQIGAGCGYRRPDQLARDFRRAFGIAPTQARGGRCADGADNGQ